MPVGYKGDGGCRWMRRSSPNEAAPAGGKEESE